MLSLDCADRASFRVLVCGIASFKVCWCAERDSCSVLGTEELALECAGVRIVLATVCWCLGKAMWLSCASVDDASFWCADNASCRVPVCGQS